MALPTLDQLLTIFRDHDLPADVDPEFKDATVDQLPVCSQSATMMERMYAYPDENKDGASDSPNNVIFLDPDTAASSFLDVDSSLYRRFLSATGGAVFLNKSKTKGGGEVSSVVKLDMCRSAAPTSGTGASARYSVFATNKVIPIQTDDDILDNHPDLPALREINLDLKSDEIVAIVKGMNLDRLHYAVNRTNTDRPRLLIMPEDSQVKSMIAFINGPNSPIAADRRGAIVTAINETVNAENEQRRLQKESSDMQRDGRDMQKEGLDLQRGMRNEMRWQMLGMGALTVYSTLLALGKAGAINSVVSYPLRGVYNLFRVPFDGGAGLKKWMEEPAEAFRYQGISTVLGSGTNLTEQARKGELREAADPTTPRMAELIENRINAPVRAGSAVFEAPPGWGKQVLMEQLALRNPKTIFVQVTPDSLMSGTMYRGSLEQKLKDIPAEIERALKKGQRVVLCIDEFHEAALAGKSMEETRTLLERWKGPLAQGTLRIVGFSTPQEMIKVRYAAGFYGTRERPEGRDHLNADEKRMVEDFDADPTIRPNIELRALLNRFQRISALDQGGIRPASDIELMIKNEVEYQKTANGMNIDISDEAISEIARLSLSDRPYEGYIPRNSFAIFDQVLTQQSQAARTGEPVKITVENIRSFVKITYPAIASRLGFPDDAPAPAPKYDGSKTTIRAAGSSDVLRGAEAIPVDNIDAEVVRAQVLQRFPRFLSQGARDALFQGKDLPTNPDELINSQFKREVDALTNRIVAQYHLKMNDDRSDIDRRWQDQIRDDGYVTREGVPDSFLRDVSRDYFNRESARTGSPFNGSGANSFRADTDRALDISEFEKNMELLRHVGR